MKPKSRYFFKKKLVPIYISSIITLITSVILIYYTHSLSTTSEKLTKEDESKTEIKNKYNSICLIGSKMIVAKEENFDEYESLRIQFEELRAFLLVTQDTDVENLCNNFLDSLRDADDAGNNRVEKSKILHIAKMNLKKICKKIHEINEK